MKKFFLISFILTAILLSLVSWTKKEKEKDSPVVVAAVERTEESRTPAVASEEEKEEDRKEADTGILRSGPWVSGAAW